MPEQEYTYYEERAVCDTSYAMIREVEDSPSQDNADTSSANDNDNDDN